MLVIRAECDDPPRLRGDPAIKIASKDEITRVIKIQNRRGHPLPRPKRMTGGIAMPSESEACRNFMQTSSVEGKIRKGSGHEARGAFSQ